MTYKLQSVFLIFTSSYLFGADKLPIGGISHAGFRVADLDKTRAFYTGVLGFQQAFEQKDPAGKTSLSVLKINEDQFLEFSPGPATGADRLSHVAFLTQKLEALRQLVESLGLQPPELRTGRDRTRNFSIRDPDEHRVEFVRYEADSLQAQARGKFADDRRISTHLRSVGFASADYDRSLAFFQGRLGFREIHHGILEPPGADGENIGLTPKGAVSYLWFDVPDVEKTMRTLHQRGWAGDLVRDPDGTPIHLKASSR